MLVSAGLPARNTSFFGDGGFMDKLAAADPRIGYALNWVAAGQPSVGGYPIVGNSTEGALHFTPDQDFDTIVVYDVDGPNDAPFTVRAEGDDENESNGMPPPTTRSGAGRTEMMVTRGHHTITVSPTLNDPTYGKVRLLGIDTYDSSVKEASVWNLGFSGSTTEEWTKAGYAHAPLTVLGQLRPNLTFINLGINDLVRKTDMVLFRANLIKIARAAAKSGSVVLVEPNRTNPAYTPDVAQDALDKAIEVAGAELHAPVVSLPKVLGSYSDAKRNGLMSDDTHLSGAGYRIVADVLSQVALAK